MNIKNIVGLFIKRDEQVEKLVNENTLDELYAKLFSLRHSLNFTPLTAIVCANVEKAIAQKRRVAA